MLAKLSGWTRLWHPRALQSLVMCLVVALLIAIIRPLFLVQGPTVQSPPIRSYIVQPGDTLWGISHRIGVSITDLIKENGIKNPRLLRIGQRLRYVLPLNSNRMVKYVTVSVGSSVSMRVPVVAKLNCTLTAYTAGFESTGKRPGDAWYGITSTGSRAIQGKTIAVDPNVIPYGSTVFIPGVGFRVAQDTGGAIVGNHIDVFYNNVSVARQFGVKYNQPVFVLPSWWSSSSSRRAS